MSIIIKCLFNYVPGKSNFKQKIYINEYEQRAKTLPLKVINIVKKKFPKSFVRDDLIRLNKFK